MGVLGGGAFGTVDRPRQDARRVVAASSVRRGQHTLARRPLHRHVLDAADEVRPQPVSGSPASCMSGRRRGQLAEDQAGAPCGRGWRRGRSATPPPPNATWGFGSRVDVERERVVEHLFVAVGRDVPDDDLVARLDLLGRGSRCRPARCGGSAAPVSPSAGSPRPRRRCGLRDRSSAISNCSGWVEERAHAVRGRVAGGLVAGHREQQDEHVELELAQLLAVDLGVEQLGDDVVARIALAQLAASSLA